MLATSLFCNVMIGVVVFLLLCQIAMCIVVGRANLRNWGDFCAGSRPLPKLPPLPKDSLDRDVS